MSITIDLKDKKAIVFGIANDKSIAWHIAKRLNDAGCRIAAAYQERVEPLFLPLMKEGLSSVNISMLDENTRRKILSDVGEKLFREGRFSDAIDIMAKTGDFFKLLEKGDNFLKEGKSELAAMCFIPTKDKPRLNSVAVLLIQAQRYELAARTYEAAENAQMASFIRENFA